MAKSKKPATPEADIKGSQMTASKELAPIAKEINKKWELATQSEDKAYDYRLSAAIKASEAEAKCRQAKIDFKKWSESNLVDITYRTVRQLVQIGNAPDPAEHLEALRVKNALANQRLRDKQKTLAAPAQKPSQGSSVDAGSKTSAPATPRRTPTDQILDGFDHVEEDAGHKLVVSMAGRYGLHAIPKEEVAAAKAAVEAKKVGIVTRGKDLFNMMGASDKMMFLKWALDEVGLEIETDMLDGVEEVRDGEIPEMPAMLDRTRKNRGRTKAAA